MFFLRKVLWNCTKFSGNVFLLIPKIYHGNMINDTHVMFIKINYVEDTEQQSQRSVLMRNIADTVPSILVSLIILRNYG